ncbi:carboxypeptidase regulatory-like domain-containing protein [Candidatus Poribacteria bacterium]|nr:carboxypeptidase regulatory-like domain-containing protein [Candidatus Poribacteria bacterium]
MRTKRLSGCISILLVLSIMIYPLASPGIVQAASAGDEVLILKPGALEGTLVDTAGKPLPKISVRVLDKNGATVAKDITDKVGKFSFKKLEAGNYTLSVGDKYNYDLKLALQEQAESSEMKVVIPETAGVKQAYTVSPVLVGGVVVAVVAGIAAAASGGGGGGSSHTVSP